MTDSQSETTWAVRSSRLDRAEGSIRVMFRCDNPGEVYVAVVKDDVTWEPREPDADLRAHAKNVASQLEDIYGKI